MRFILLVLYSDQAPEFVLMHLLQQSVLRPPDLNARPVKDRVTTAPSSTMIAASTLRKNPGTCAHIEKRNDTKIARFSKHET